METSADEASRPTDQAIELLKALFNDYDEFYVELENEFQGDTADLRRKARQRRRWFDRGIGFLLGVGASFIVSLGFRLWA